MNNKLTFSHRNKKLQKLSKVLGERVYSFSLLSGYTCPGAHECLAKVIQTKTGLRVRNGKNQRFRCYSASQEALYSNLYRGRRNNFHLLRECKTFWRMTRLILESLPHNLKICRLHVGGDFFSQNYFDAWNTVAKIRDDAIFYGYTKALPYYVARLGDMPTNFRLIASYGGRYDSMIDQYNLPSAKVVFTEKQAEDMGLELDTDDSHAFYGKTFALMIHGTQTKENLKSGRGQN